MGKCSQLYFNTKQYPLKRKLKATAPLLTGVFSQKKKKALNTLGALKGRCLACAITQHIFKTANTCSHVVKIRAVSTWGKKKIPPGRHTLFHFRVLWEFSELVGLERAEPKSVEETVREGKENAENCAGFVHSSTGF